MPEIIINEELIAPINWRDPSVCDFKLAAGTAIWQIDTTVNSPYLKNYLSVLQQEEIARANRYLSKTDRNNFIISRGAIRHLLSRYLEQPAADINFETGPNHKPFLAGFPLHFNLSDSGNKILIAIAKAEIGIDVEYIKPQFGYDDIMHNYFNPLEADYIKQTDSLNRFFLLWTRKEAILKATGVGLTDDLYQVPALAGKHIIQGDFLGAGSNWLLNSFTPAHNYIATLASYPQNTFYSFWEFNFNCFMV